jgi:hypothetical protein
VNIQDDASIVTNPTTGAPLLTNLPGANIVRVPAGSYGTPEHYDPLVTELTNLGVVVLLENHQNFNADGSNAGGAGGGAGVILTGQLLATETTWYTNLASHFKSNPYVWFGTNNEPAETDANGNHDPAGLSVWQQTTYNAIRGTGNNSPILIEAIVDMNFLQGYVNIDMTVSIYKQMTNMVWDFHIYNWVFNYVDDQPLQLSDSEKIINLLKTNWQSADGTPAVICGEYGPSTDGQTNDVGGKQTFF